VISRRALFSALAVAPFAAPIAVGAAEEIELSSETENYEERLRNWKWPEWVNDPRLQGRVLYLDDLDRLKKAWFLGPDEYNELVTELQSKRLLDWLITHPV